MDPNAEGAVPPEDTNMQAAAPPQDAPPGVMHPGQMDMLGQPPQDGFVVDAEAGIGVMKVDPESIPTTTAGVPPTETPAPEVPPPAEQPVVDSVVKAEIAEGTTDDRPATQSKKRMSKPVKKVLYAKKESDMAAAFISGKKDLSGILNKDDCRFVAHSFYCFTLDQLDYIVKTGLGEDSKDKTMILSKMENSSSNVLTIPEEPKEEAPVEGEAPKEGDAMDVDPKPDGEEKPSEEPAAAPEATAEPEELREKAIKKLEYWQTIASQARDAPSSLSISESFPLDGAVQILFPATVSNFLKSVQITSLMAWLSLKKTETGKICEYFLRWRVKCGYGQVPPLGVAKYLLGVSNRIETFISANPPIDEETRNWMLDPIVVMTGAARDFLVEDQKITTAFDFVHTRTKDLSLALADWREKKGFEPLKGSGKVAMISGWKATAREVLEIEQGYGKALTDPEDLAGLDLSEEEVGTPMDLTPLPSRKARRSMGSVVSVNDPNAPLEITSERKLKRKKTEYNLHSKFYLDETLGEEETDLLAGIDIHTAAQFLEIDEEIRGYLVEEIVDAKMAADAEAAGALIDQWKLTMEEDLGPYKNFAKKKRKLNPEAARAASQARKTRSSERGSGKKSKSHPHHKAIKPSTMANVSDPFELLSTVTKEFLTSIGITTAEQFLGTRTTDIAADFVTFRKEKGMPELKGLGSIASVSGWKANCRKFCIKMGFHDVAEVEPIDKFTTKPEGPGVSRNRKKMKEEYDDGEDEEPAEENEEEEDNDEVPFASQRKVLAVQGRKKGKSKSS